MKSKKKMLLALGAMSAAAIGAGATSTFAWYSAVSSAPTINHDTDAYTVAVVETGATAATVKFTAQKGTVKYVQANSTERTNGGLVLTNSTGQTGYVNNGYVALRSIAATEAGYGYCPVTIKATLTAGDSLYDAIQYLDSNSYKLYPAVDPTTLVRAYIGASYDAAVYSNAADSTRFGAALDLVDNATGLNSTATEVTYSYKVFFSIVPKHDATTANGSAAETTVSNATNVIQYDTAADHEADGLTVGSLVASSAPTDGTTAVPDDVA